MQANKASKANDAEIARLGEPERTALNDLADGTPDGKLARRLCATVFLRAGHNFIRHGEMPPLRFAWVLVRFAGGQVAKVVRSLGVHLRKAAAPPKPVIFDRTPKKGA